jgi:hypothetical protein
MKKLIVVVMLALIPAICSASDVSTKVGEVVGYSGDHVALYVKKTGEGANEMVGLAMFVSDEYIVNQVYINLSPEKLQQLRDLLDATMVEYKKQEANISPEAKATEEKLIQIKKKSADMRRSARKEAGLPPLDEKQ